MSVAGPASAWLFDFDGVLVESNEVKEEAFVGLYPDHPQHHDAIRWLHRSMGATHRAVKIAKIELDLLGAPADEARVASLCDRFSELVVEEVIASPWVEGASEVLQRLQGGPPLFVVSGTPEAELRRIVAARGIDHLFADVLGAPTGKRELVRRLVEGRRLDRASTVMVGDAVADMRAALAAGIAFVARTARHTPPELAEWPHRVADLHDLFEVAETALAEHRRVLSSGTARPASRDRKTTGEVEH